MISEILEKVNFFIFLNIDKITFNPLVPKEPFFYPLKKSENGKIRTRITTTTDTSHAVSISKFISLFSFPKSPFFVFSIFFIVIEPEDAWKKTKFTWKNSVGK